jgi:hypothetical protein
MFLSARATRYPPYRRVIGFMGFTLLGAAMKLSTLIRLGSLASIPSASSP